MSQGHATTPHRPPATAADAQGDQHRGQRRKARHSAAQGPARPRRAAEGTVTHP
nr:MAG TPA: hypothetical protein [Caudoviricetes sp.]